MDESAQIAALRAQNEVALAASGEPMIDVGGVPVPLSMAGAAVARCIAAIRATDKLIQQGFASKEELEALKLTLTGEDEPDAARTEDVVH